MELSIYLRGTSFMWQLLERQAELLLRPTIQTTEQKSGFAHLQTATHVLHYERRRGTVC
jgi:hypothetical protein